MKVNQSYTLIDPIYNRRRIEDMTRAINGQMEFGTPTKGQEVSSNNNINMSGTWVQVNTGPANTTFTVTHNLGRVPTGMLTFSVDQPGAVVHAVNKNLWTTKVAFFQSNVANVNLEGFVT